MTPFQVDTHACAHILREGGVAIFPTDTIWAIGCDARNEKAVQRILKIKRRSAEKGFVLIDNTFDRLRADNEWLTDAFIENIERKKEPITFVYDKLRRCAASVSHQNGSLAVRVVRQENLFCYQLIDLVGFPLVASSANISDAPSPTSSEVDEQICVQVDFVANCEQEGETALYWGKPSTIYTLDKKYNIWIKLR